jgi:predicted nucleic acid-binding protein
VRFWDASAVIPICVREPRSDGIEELLAADGDMIVWWGTLVECASAVARRRRDGAFSATDERHALAVLRRLAAAWNTVTATEAVRERALRLVRIHPLRAADGLQLAAALAWAEDAPGGRQLLTFDNRLAEAARLEGFEVPT